MTDQFSSEDVPLVPAALRGYRQWHVRRTTGVGGYREGIYSLNNTRWTTGELHAACELLQTKIHIREGRRDALRAMINTLDPNDQQTWPSVDDFVANFETYEVEHKNKAPQQGCQCGIYSLHFPGEWLQRATLTPEHATLSGVIKGAGRALVGTLGFRSQRAVIEAVYVPPVAYAVYSSIVMRQAPQATLYSDEAVMYREHPPEDLTSIFGAAVAQRMANGKTAYLAQNPEAARFTKFSGM